MKLSAKSELATFIVGLGLFAAAGGFAWWTLNGGTKASAQQTRPERAVAVSVARADLGELPFRLDALGTVQPIVSVIVRSRVDSQVEGVHFTDGATVKQDDLLFTLDARAIDAQIRQAEAVLARDKAQLEKSDRDLERVRGLVERGTYTPVQLADARTNNDMLKATVAQDEATLQNLRVLRTYYEIRSPADGRIGIAGVRPGAVVRAADAAAALATVNQMSPIYVAFAIPGRYVADLRAAGDRAMVAAVPQGLPPISGGRVAFIENAVDAQSATILVRARFDNKDEQLWPGTLVNVQLTLRVDRGVVVPVEAVQSGQRGTFVFVVENGAAKVRTVKVMRTVDRRALIGEGLRGGETVVTEGQLSLRDGSRVDIKRAPGA